MAKGQRQQTRPSVHRARSDLIAFGFVALLLWGVTFLPPDTTLRLVRESGVLRVCVPERFEPLVSGDPTRPGIDLELLQAVADDLEVRLITVTNSAIGRDFNPRNWRVTRAQCLVLAGGIVDSVGTRGFLVVTTPHLETGWAAVHGETPPPSLEGVEVGFFSGLSGLDRVALSRWLRGAGAAVTVLTDERAATAALASGRVDIVVSEALTARRIAAATGGSAVWLPVEGSRVPIAFGMWKGDLTLERAIEASLRRLQRDGVVSDVIDRYALAPIGTHCDFCP